MSTFIGIDPGKSGGIAMLYESDAEPELKSLDTDKTTEHDIAAFIAGIPEGVATYCVIERVGPNRIRRQGERAQGASSMFSFGKNYGFLRGVLAASGVRFVDVPPTKWQAAMQVKGAPDEPSTAKKNRHKAKAQQLYPRIPMTHWKADALLLATYCRRHHHELF